MGAKDFIKDKSIKVAKGAVYTGAAVVDAGKKVTTTATMQAVDTAITYAPDYTTEHHDFETGASETLAGSAVMTGRTAGRVVKSAFNIYHSHEIRSLDADIALSEANVARIEGRLKAKSLSAKQKGALKRSLAMEQDRLRKLKRKRNKVKAKIKGGFHPLRSTLRIGQNQLRRGMSRVASANDFATNTVGKMGQFAWGSWRYGKTALRFARRTVAIVKWAVHGIVAFVTSIPAIVTTVISSVPLLVVVVVCVSFAAFFGSNLEYTGRVLELAQNEIRLENAYQTGFLPDEILAISQTLGWTSNDLEDYEVLLSFAYDGGRGEKPSFEKMMDNVFRKYNPAIKFRYGTPLNQDADSGFDYYHSSLPSLANLGNSSIKKKNVTVGAWLDIYPKYKEGNGEFKKEYGNRDNIAALKRQCREALEINGYNAVNAFIQIDSQPTIFTSYVIDADKASSSSVVGYRSILLNGSYDNSFHGANDIPAAGGTPVYAPTDGVVVYADGSQTAEGTSCGLWGSGNVVIIRKDVIDANGEPAYLYIMMAHLQHNSVTVKAGQKVSSGARVARVGTTGTSTGNHLHFQCWLSNKKINRMTSNHWFWTSPKSFTDSQAGKKYTVDDKNYNIYIDGMMLYDVEYRNKIFNR